MTTATTVMGYETEIRELDRMIRLARANGAKGRAETMEDLRADLLSQLDRIVKREPRP